VELAFSMLDMDMGRQYLGQLRHSGPGRYSMRYDALGMPGRWELRLVVTPTSGKAFAVVLVDRMGR
jgi:hypothetical protein